MNSIKSFASIKTIQIFSNGNIFAANGALNKKNLRKPRFHYRDHLFLALFKGIPCLLGLQFTPGCLLIAVLRVMSREFAPLQYEAIIAKAMNVITSKKIISYSIFTIRGFHPFILVVILLNVTNFHLFLFDNKLEFYHLA